MHNPRSLPLKRVQQQLARRSTDFYATVIRSVILDLDPSSAELVNGWLRSKSYDRLLDYADSLVSQKYETAWLHFQANQLAALIRKFPFPGQADVAVDRAWRKFRDAERRCRHFNRYHRNLRSGFDGESYVKHFMRSWISYVIGYSPVLPEIYSKCDFGPGASIGVTGNATNFARKLSAEKLSGTLEAFPYFVSAIRSNPLIVEYFLSDEEDAYPLPYADLERDPHIETRWAKVGYNKIDFVPKTTREFRSIAVEPVMNGFVQKGIDEVLRARLKRVGLDLTDQTRNQELAHLGSLPDDPNPYCTIDLSSASDTICIEVVKDLLPPDWFYLLDQIRSKQFMYKGNIYRYHKFVSMGNGFCFPLQTLIFASICHGACAEIGVVDDFRVYGDDIIVRRDVFHRVLELLRHFGFRPNPRKTFGEGPFRESCGKDYFGGIDVRPIYLDYELDSLQSLFKFHNALNHVSQWWDVRPLQATIRSWVPTEWRFLRYLPGNADSAFEVSHDLFLSGRGIRWNPRLFSWSWPELFSIPVNDNIEHCPRAAMLLLMAALRGSSASAPYTVRRKTKTFVRIVSHNGG